MRNFKKKLEYPQIVLKRQFLKLHLAEDS